MDFFIRPATPQDAEGIINAHYETVHTQALPFYTPEICAVWSPKPTSERIARYRDTILPRELTLVAASPQNTVLGFGVLEPQNAYIKAVYVHPNACGNGVGKALLAQLEIEARVQGLSSLKLSSSLNAEPFYRAQGYRVKGRGFHTLNTGLEMACVHMHKELPTL